MGRQSGMIQNKQGIAEMRTWGVSCAISLFIKPRTSNNKDLTLIKKPFEPHPIIRPVQFKRHKNERITYRRILRSLKIHPDHELPDEPELYGSALFHWISVRP